MGWWERSDRWRERHVWHLDAAGTAVFALVGLAGTLVLSVAASVDGPLWAVAVVVPLAWRRTRPVASVVGVYTVGLLHTVLGSPLLWPADMAVLVALYSVTVYGPRWAHRTAVAGGIVGSFLLGVALYLTTGAADLGAMIIVGVFASTACVAVWASGLAKRARRETLLALRDRAERLEVERDQQARIATSAERARIAREMHDIVAHSLSVVVAQADGGRYAAQADPDAAGRALGTIAETGRAALADMRRLLGVLRTADETGADGDGGTAELVPQPAAQDIERLVDSMRASGMTVSLVRMGTPRPLPPGAGLTAYRICQESLTNVLKHAGPDPSVTVLVQWSPTALTVEVTDDGRGAAATGDGAGQGLTGMRERAAMFGGTVTAGPRAGGGFRVRARLPLPSSA
ncbi:sensor histidine kinase [uncultured Cellulomonas sp.]|uniref:sensor histidine kinase n=1 Tax=uncultured Cellulomonas sp. TaxID=189682 RepID=UPI002604030C|nr:histidine kinase [uncultured Cellulomonas sp.]